VLAQLDGEHVTIAYIMEVYSFYIFSLLMSIYLAQNSIQPLMLNGHIRDLHDGTFYNLHITMAENGAGHYSQYQDASQGKCRGCFGYGTMVLMTIQGANTPNQVCVVAESER
jgi:hypothetical protein